MSNCTFYWCLNGPRREKTCLWWFANKGVDQPVLPCSLRFEHKIRSPEVTLVLWFTGATLDSHVQSKPLVCSLDCPCLHWLFRFSALHSNKPLSSLLYKAIYTMYGKRKIKSEWPSNVEKCLNELGFPGIWQLQSCHNMIWLKKAFKKISDQYI